MVPLSDDEALWNHPSVKLRLLLLTPCPPGLVPALLAGFPWPWQSGEVLSCPLPPQLGFNGLRQQANAFDLLQALPTPAEGETLLALTETDLFMPALTFVFGASQRGARRSLVSLARLKPETFNAELLLRRVLVEPLHELGHGAGLAHCVLAVCPMHQSFHPQAVDLKETLYCPACGEHLARLLFPRS